MLTEYGESQLRRAVEQAKRQLDRAEDKARAQNPGRPHAQVQAFQIGWLEGIIRSLIIDIRVFALGEDAGEPPLPPIRLRPQPEPPEAA